MKTLRANKVYPDKDYVSMTKTSKFILFLLQICFLSIKQKEDKISFSKCKTFVYILASIGWYLIIAIVSLMTGAVEVTELYNAEERTCDWSFMIMKLDYFQRTLLQNLILKITIGIAFLGGALFPISLRYFKVLWIFKRCWIHQMLAMVFNHWRRTFF